MKNINQATATTIAQSPQSEEECGNCWGHQQYEQGYRPKKRDYWRDHKDNFISRFVRKYLR